MNYSFHRIPIIDLPVVFATNKKGLAKGFEEGLKMEKKTAQDLSDHIAIGDEECAGYCDLVKNVDGSVVCGYIVVHKKTDINTIAHEATHLAVFALDWAEIQYTADNHEILAYLVGYLVGKFKEPWKKYGLETSC